MLTAAVVTTTATTTALSLTLPKLLSPLLLSLLQNPNFNLNRHSISATFRRHTPRKMPPSSAAAAEITAEYAKSNKSACKTCNESIDQHALRLGVVTNRGYTMTKWHHFHCLSFDSLAVDSAESISGFNSLKSDDQEALKKKVDDRVEVKDVGEATVAEEKLKSTKKRKVKETDGDVSTEDKPESTNKRKTKDRDENVDSLEREPQKLQSAAITAEYAKSQKSTCKTCNETIDKNALRLGVVTKDKQRGFNMTKWHHFQCLSFDSLAVDSAESISGFNSLKSDDQEALKKKIDDRVEVKDVDEDTVAEDKLKSTKNKKTKDSDEDDDSLEKEPRKLKLSVSDGAEIVLKESDIKDKYKDATLLPKWRAFHSIIFLEKDDGLHDSSKIAAFDFDGCLANTNVKVTGADAWSLMYPSISDKLQNLYNDGFKLVIFTNESNIDRWTKKRQKAVDSKVGRLNNFIKLVNVPIQVFIACGFDKIGRKDAYRKPQPGMWRVMEKHFNSGIEIDMDHSFYVGDAAGRENDHSDADIKFAQAIGLKFYLPEEFFDTKD